ncbi:hypothetical protein VZT92_007255 [Zoarces viviparus]|uniref:Uncharacterized protein n=1 Tax=Zoarces viviparus TaxID=48416 RepID=A0AAW1FJT9_ZOAVI
MTVQFLQRESDPVRGQLMTAHERAAVGVWRRCSDCVLQCLTLFTCRTDGRLLGQVRFSPSVTNEEGGGRSAWPCSSVVDLHCFSLR